VRAPAREHTFERMQNPRKAGGRHARRTRAEWMVDVVRWRQSGVSSEVYADHHGLNRSSLLAWSAKLGPQLPEQDVPPPAATTRAFVPLRVRADAAAAATALNNMGPGHMEIVLSNGRSVRVRGVVDAAELAQVIAVVEGARC